MAYDEALAARVHGIMATLPGFTEKKMFGGVGYMLAGNMACGVNGDDLIARVGPDRYEEALADWRKALTTDPLNPETYFDRGRYYFEAGELDLALTDFDQYISAESDFAPAYYFRGKIHDALANAELAIADYQRFLDLAPNAFETDEVTQRIEALQD